MRKSNIITDIPDIPVECIGKSPLAIEICNISHTPVHVHSTVTEFVYCLKGHVDLYCNHENVRVCSGEMYTIDYYDLHCLYSDEDNVTLLTHIDFSHNRIYYGNIFTAYIDCADDTVHSFQEHSLHQVKARLLATAYAFYNGELSEAKAEKASVDLMKILLPEFNWFNQLDFYPNENPEMFDRTTTVVTHVVEHYTEKLSVSYFAKKLNISDNYVSQFFKRSPYGSFSNLLGYIRCYYAQRLLLSSDMSVMEIAHACGFSDYKYFYKHFTLWWKLKPSDYRKWFSSYVARLDSVDDFSDYEVLRFLSGYISDFFISTYI